MSLADGSMKWRFWFFFCWSLWKNQKKIHSGATSLGWNDFTVAPNKHSQLWIIFFFHWSLVPNKSVDGEARGLSWRKHAQVFIEKKPKLFWQVEQLSHDDGSGDSERSVSRKTLLNLRSQWWLSPDNWIDFIYVFCQNWTCRQRRNRLNVCV